MDTLVDFLSSQRLALLYLWLYLAADHIQKLLQMLCQMLMAVMLTRQTRFSTRYVKISYYGATQLNFLCFSLPSQILLSSPLPSNLSALRESTPRGRADLSAPMAAPPLTPRQTALSDR